MTKTGTGMIPIRVSMILHHPLGHHHRHHRREAVARATVEGDELQALRVEPHADDARADHVAVGRLLREGEQSTEPLVLLAGPAELELVESQHAELVLQGCRPLVRVPQRDVTVPAFHRTGDRPADALLDGTGQGHEDPIEA